MDMIAKTVAEDADMCKHIIFEDENARACAYMSMYIKKRSTISSKNMFPFKYQLHTFLFEYKPHHQACTHT